MALIIGDPGTISKSSSLLRGFSIALVSVLIAQSLWSTARLIEELIVGGPHTNKPGPLLTAAGIVWVSNNIAFGCCTGSSTVEARRNGRTRSAIIPT